MSAPGRRVATGRLRVDAGRAVAKLREYQLLERRLWILEALRGAVGAGASAITVDCDADDVWVCWEGSPPSGDELGALLDELVSPAVDPKRRWARLLATAVNTALGEGTRFVDVWRIADGEAEGFRYAPALLQERDEDDQALRPTRLEDEQPMAPRLPSRGVVVQVRRRFGTQVMGRWLTGAVPPELELLQELRAAERSRVPLSVRAEAIDRDRDVLVSVELGERARMVLLRASSGHVRPFLCHWLELGVPLSMTVLFPELDSLRGAVPAAMIYDSDRLPTNAARSEVRLDEGGLDHVVRRVTSVGIDELVSATVESHQEAMKAGDELRAEAIRGAILAWIGAHCGGVDWRNAFGALPTYLAPFRRIELVRNAVGQWKRLGAIDPGPVLRTDEPEEPDLEPWLGRVLWAPSGDPTRFLFAGQNPPQPKRQLRDANGALAAKRRWLAHDQREPVVADGPGQWLSVRFGPGENRGRSALPLERYSARQRGEVCLLDPQAATPSQEGIGTVTLLHEGRPLGSARFLSPIPYVAVVESDRLEPTGDYRGCQPDKAYENVLAAAQMFALRAAELLLGLVENDGRELPDSARSRDALDPEPRMPELRAAVHAAVQQLNLSSKQVVTQLRGPFRDAPVFELHEDDDVRRVSLRDLSERFESEEAVVQAASTDALPAGRPIVFDPSAAKLLKLRFPRKPVLHYDVSLAGRRPQMDERSIRSAIWRPDYPMLTVDLGDVRGAIAWSGLGPHGQSMLHRMHRGVRIDQLSFEAAFERCKVAMDDDRIVPTPGWDGVALQPELEEQIGRFEQAICQAVVDALAGEEVGGLRIRGDIRKLSHVHEAILRAATHETALDDDRRRTLRRLALIPTVGGTKQTVDGLASHPEVAWVERYEAHLRGVPTDLVIADEGQAETLALLTGKPARHAKRELEEARRDHRRSTNLALHRRQAERSVPSPSPTGAQVRGKHVLEGVAEIGNAGVSKTRVDVRIEGRAFTRLEADGPPIDAIVAVPLDAATAEFDGLRDGVADMLMTRVRRASGAMLEQVAARSPRLIHDHQAWASLLEHWLDEHFLQQSKATRRTRQALVAAEAFPATQGGFTSIEAASSDKQVRVSEPLGDWLGPADGEEPHYLDSPTLAIGEAQREWVEKLALGKRVYDVSRSMGRLQDSRRIEQGLVERPVLRQIPASLKATLEEVSGSSRRRWMIGEIGLRPAKEATLHVYAGGREVRTIPLELEPAVAVALEASDLAEEGATLSPSLHRHLETRVQRLLEETILPNLATLPRWVDGVVRRAWLLSGALRDGDVAGVPLFETTAGARVSLEDLHEQAKRYGSVWVTTASSFLERTRVPLDPQQIALRLSAEEMAALGTRVSVEDGEAELKLDEELRQNLAKTPATSLDLPASLAPMLLGSRPIESKHTEGVVGLLHGSAAREQARLFVHRERVPLGELPCLAGWPFVARFDDPTLSPDRVHGAPMKDPAWERLTRALRAERDALWQELIPDAPDDALASVTVRRNPSWGSVRGRLWITNPRHSGSVQVAYGKVAQSLSPRVGSDDIPVRGHLWVAHREGEKYTQTQDVIAASFEMLCRQIEKKVSAENPDGYALLLRAELIGAFECREPIRQHALPGLDGVTIETLVVAKLDGLSAVRECLPPDLGDAPRVIRSVLGQSFPSWVLRGKGKAAPVERPKREDPPSSSTTRTLKKEKKKKREKPIRRAHPLDFLAAALAKALRELGLPTKVVVAPRRKRHLVRYDTSQEALVLSGAHPQLVALQADRIARGGNADRGMRLLIAHSVGVLDRALTAVTAASQQSVTRALLGQQPRR